VSGNVLASLSDPFLFKDNFERELLISSEKNITEKAQRGSTHIFSNMPTSYQMKGEASYKNYKELLKKIATLNLNSRVEIGLDRMKAAPLAFKMNDSLGVDQGLLSSVKQASGFKSRGYGIELRIKLD
jgi:hypothetical protein